MATKDFISFTPDSGAANTPTEVTVTVPKAYYGREQRSTLLRVSAASNAQSYQDVQVINSAAAQFIESITAPANIGSGGASVIFSVFSNAAGLYLRLSQQAHSGLPAYVNITDAQVALTDENGQGSTAYVLSGNTSQGLNVLSIGPGTGDVYKLQVTVGIGANDLTSTKTFTMEVSMDSGFEAVETAVVTQAAGAATVSVQPSEVTIPAEGGSGTFTVTSNDDFSIA